MQSNTKPSATSQSKTEHYDIKQSNTSQSDIYLNGIQQSFNKQSIT